MSECPPIDDDELLIRHIPDGTRWQAPGPRITSANFELRRDRGETGVSVTRRRWTSEEELLKLVRSTKGSKIAAATVGDIVALGFRVVPCPTAADPGHCEIQSADASLDDQAARRRLARAFRFLTREPP